MARHSQRSTLALRKLIEALPGHRFFPDNISFIKAPQIPSLQGTHSSELTDLYFLAFAVLLAVVVTPASKPEREGVQVLLSQHLNVFNWMRVIWVDSGYSGSAFAQWVSSLKPKLKIEVVKRPDSDAEFKVVPKRWIVERTFGWLIRHKCLVSDYEKTESSAGAWIRLAMIRIQLNRLA